LNKVAISDNVLFEGVLPEQGQMRKLLQAICGAALFISLCLGVAYAQTPPPDVVYQHFRDYILSGDSDDAFLLLDEHAKVETAATLRTILQVMGVEKSKLDQMSDYQIFSVVMKHQNSISIKILDTRISGNSAFVRTEVVSPHSNCRMDIGLYIRLLLRCLSD
jgi:hypothetical protein